ncbi:MAG: PAS domain S-box protein [Anaerolineales bacterium]|nr:PAS domain S-box protein [Anaerolineales bacterium]
MNHKQKRQIGEITSHYASEELYQVLFEQAGDGIFIADPQGSYLEVNRQSCQMLGYSREELLHLSIQDLIPAEDLVSQPIRLAELRTGQSMLIERRLCCKDGRLLPVEIRKQMMADGRILAFVHDITERRRIEEATRESEQKIRSFIEQSSEGFILVDEQGLIIEWNQASEEITGLRRAQVIGRPSWEVQQEMLPPEVRTLERYERNKQTIVEALRTGQSFIFNKTLEAQVMKPDGTRRFLQQTVFPIKTDQGYQIGSVSRDITEQRRANDQLRQLSRVVEQSPASIVITNTMGNIEYVNPKFTQVTGYTLAEAIGQNPNLLKSGYTSPEEYQRLWDTITSGGQWRGEFQNRKKNGDLYWEAATISPILNEQGEITHFLAIKEDINERKRAEEALHEMAENMAVAQRMAHFGSWEVKVTPELEIVEPQLWSDEYYRILGFEPRSVQATSKLFRSCLHPDDCEFATQMIFKAIQERTEISYEYRIVRPDGSIRYIHDRANVVLDERTGRPVKVVGTAHDITERRQAEEAQAKLEEQLRQAHKMESVGRLAGGIAHDFNNLLTVIRGYCDLMQPQIPGGDPLRKDLEQIRRAAERAAALTRQLLAFSRKQMLAPTNLDLNDLVTNLHKMLGRLIGEDINLVLVLQPGLWPVKADPGQIEQVIVNLAVNARDAMPTGGMLTIETGNVRLDDNYLKTHPEAPHGPCVMLAVTDTGQGMDAPTQAHIFEPFFTTKEVGQGTGLGLATVYGIIKQSGGDITLYSKPGHGTTFKIYLPAGEPIPDVAVPPTPPVSHAGTETILLVEDEEGVRNLIGRTLKSKGYTVLEARHGDEALLLAGQHQRPIDLLLTDVIMPQMSGRDLTERLKAFQPSIKVLFMSGYTDDAVVRHGLLTAEVEFLSKPFSPDTLAAKVRRVLDK